MQGRSFASPDLSDIRRLQGESEYEFETQPSSNGNYFLSAPLVGPGPGYAFLVDTGSPYTWLPDSTYNPMNYNQSLWWYGVSYNCTAESECNPIANTTGSYASYIDAVDGYMANVTLNWTNTNIAVVNQSIVLATYIGNGYLNLQEMITNNTEVQYDAWAYEGVLGLGMTVNASYPSIIKNLFNQGVVTDQWFSLYYQGDPYFNNQLSVIGFQEINPNLTVSQWTNVTTAGNSRWSFNINNFALEDFEISMFNTTEAMVTSGIQYIAMPHTNYSALSEYIQAKVFSDCYSEPNGNNGLWCQCPAGDIGKLANMTFTLSSTNQTLNVSLYNYAIYYPTTQYSQFISWMLAKSGDDDSINSRRLSQSQFLETTFDLYDGYSGPFYSYIYEAEAEEGEFGEEEELVINGDLCQLLIQDNTVYNNSDYNDMWLLGVPFLLNYVAVFDEGKNQMAFASSNQPFLTMYNKGVGPGGSTSVITVEDIVMFVVLGILLLTCVGICYTQRYKIRQMFGRDNEGALNRSQND
jgi:hypothetical protein